MKTKEAAATTITFKGDPEAIEDFMSWLCEMGEQHYWDWMEYRDGGDKVMFRDFQYNWQTLTIEAEEVRHDEFFGEGA